MMLVCSSKPVLALLLSLISAITSLQPLDSQQRWRNTLEAEEVRLQLGYLPPNFCAVSARSHDSQRSAVAIQTYPLRGGAPRRQSKAELGSPSVPVIGTPFPTLFWLTSPQISKAVASLEGKGCVRLLESRLNSDAEQASRFLASHEHYARTRWNSISGVDRDLMEHRRQIDPSVDRMYNMLRYSGIAGTNHTAQRHPDGSFDASIKCLHAHYAHYRSASSSNDNPDSDKYETRYNIVGMWVHELLQDEFPELTL